MTAYRSPINRQLTNITNRQERTSTVPFSTRGRAERPAEQETRRDTAFDRLIGGQYANQPVDTQFSLSPEMDNDMEDAINSTVSAYESTPLDSLISDVTVPNSSIAKLGLGRLGKAVVNTTIANSVGVPTSQAIEAGVTSAVAPVGVLASFANSTLPGALAQQPAKRDFSNRLNDLYGNDETKKNEAIELMSELQSMSQLSEKERLAIPFGYKANLLNRLRELTPEAYHSLASSLSSARKESEPYSKQIGGWAKNLGVVARDVVTGRTLGEKISSSFDDEGGPPVGSLVSPELASETRPATDLGKALLDGLLGVPRELMDIMREISIPQEDPFSMHGMSLADALRSLNPAEKTARRAEAMQPMFGKGGYLGNEGDSGYGGNSTGSSAPGTEGRGPGSAARGGFSAYGGDDLGGDGGGGGYGGIGGVGNSGNM